MVRVITLGAYSLRPCTRECGVFAVAAVTGLDPEEIKALALEISPECLVTGRSGRSKVHIQPVMGKLLDALGVLSAVEDLSAAPVYIYDPYSAAIIECSTADHPIHYVAMIGGKCADNFKPKWTNLSQFHLLDVCRVDKVFLLKSTAP